MNSFFDKESHFEAAYGKYIQLYLRLSVNRLYTKFDGETRYAKDFIGEEIPTLFHEFVHHLQNISSILGLSYLNSIVSLWHNLRNIVDDPKNEELLDDINKALENIMFYMPNNNRNKNIYLPEIASIVAVSPSEISQKPVIVKFRENEFISDANFGIAEFLESSAYCLEQLFRQKANIKDVTNEMPAIPYKLGECIGKFYNKNYSLEDLIAIKIAALQHPAPHWAYIRLVKDFSEINLLGDKLRIVLDDLVVEFINSNISYREDTLNKIYEGFPKDDPTFGNLIIEIFELSKRHINKRLENPQMELDFLYRLTPEDYCNQLMDFIKYLGGCQVFRKMGFDSMGELIPNEVVRIGNVGSIYHNNRAWDVFQASIHYSFKFSVDKNIIKISLPFFSPECPLLESCAHSNVIKEKNKCATEPWSHPNPKGDGKDCAYQLAVFKTQLKNINIG